MNRNFFNVRKLYWPSLVFGWILLLSIFPVNALESKVVQQLQEHRLNYIQAFQQENTELLTKYYGQDIRLMPEANPTIFGKQHARMFFEALFARFEVVAYSRTKTHTLDMQSRFAELGSFELQMKNPQGQLRELKGKYLNLWDTTTNRPALLTDIWNYDHAVDFKEELKFAEIPATVTALEAHLPINTPVLFELAAYGALTDITVPLRDDKVLVQFYAHDAKVMSNYRPIIEGMNAIKDYWSVHAKALASFEKLQSRTDKVEQAGGFTLHYGSHIANWRSGEYSGVSTGKHLRIWRREPNGILKTYVLISAYDK